MKENGAKPRLRTRVAAQLSAHGASLVLIAAAGVLYGLVPKVVARESVAVTMLTLATALLVLGALLSQIQPGTRTKFAGILEFVLREVIRPRVEEEAKRKKLKLPPEQVELVSEELVREELARTDEIYARALRGPRLYPYYISKDDIARRLEKVEQEMREPHPVKTRTVRPGEPQDQADE